MSLTLHYDFATDKSLAARKGPTLGITRTTDATYFDSAGVMQTASSGVARFDHNPSTLESLGLLVEEARTNICLQSEDLSTTWITSAPSVDTPNQAVAPNGATTADKLGDDSSTGTGTIVTTQAKIFATSTAYAVSCYLKADGLDWGRIRITGLGALVIDAYFDLTNGVVGATTGADNTSEFIENVGNGWYRCGIVFTSDAADVSGNILIYVAEANNDTIVDLDGTSSIFVWGAQLEAGAFPTSYIPTVASSVTRNADAIGDADVTGLINDSEGTLFIHYRNIKDPTGHYFNINDNSTSNRVLLQAQTAGTDQFFVVDGGSIQASPSITPVDADAENMVVGAYKVNDIVTYANGSAGGTDTLATMPSGMDTLNIGTNESSIVQVGSIHIAEIRYYNERLVNSVLEDMSNGIFPVFVNTLTDLRYLALRVLVPTAPPTTNDMLFAWLATEGGTGNTLSDRWRSMLIGKGATPGHFNDMWMEVLALNGFNQPQLNDRQIAFWANGGGLI